MARSALAPQTVSVAGLTPAFTAANVDGHSIVHNGDPLYLEVKNASGAPVTVTVQTNAVSGRALADDTISVPATTGDKVIGPLDPDVHVVQSGADKGKVYVDFSAVTSVTCAAFTLPGA
jgi:hypothetical protein